MNKLLSTVEVAARLNIHRVSVSRLVRSGKLPAQRVGNSWVVVEEDLVELEKNYEGRRGRPRKDSAQKENSL